MDFQRQAAPNLSSKIFQLYFSTFLFILLSFYWLLLLCWHQNIVQLNQRGNLVAFLSKLLGKHMLRVELIWFRWADLRAEPRRLWRCCFLFSSFCFLEGRISNYLRTDGSRSAIGFWSLPQRNIVMKELWIKEKFTRKLFQWLCKTKLE